MELTKEKLQKLIKEELIKEFMTGESKELLDVDYKDPTFTITQGISYDPIDEQDDSEYISMYIYSYEQREDIDVDFTLEEFEDFKNKISRIRIKPMLKK